MKAVVGKRYKEGPKGYDVIFALEEENDARIK